MATRTDRRVGVYIDQQTAWQDEQRALRTILLDTPLTETFKWRAPCYSFGTSNICNFGPLKAGCALGFFAGELLPDPDGLLTPVGKNSRSAMRILFASVDEVERAETAIRGLVDAAIANARTGRKVTFRKDDLTAPSELITALDADPDLAKAFAALTPGRQRGYYLHFGDAKQSATRSARIEKCRDRIFAGKGFNER